MNKKLIKNRKVKLFGTLNTNIIVKHLGTICLLINILLITFFVSFGQPAIHFNSIPLKEKGDFSASMVEGIDHYLMKETELVRQAREKLWQPDFSSFEAFNNSAVSLRNLLASRTGVADTRLVPEMEVLTGKGLMQYSLKVDGCNIKAVRWTVLEGLSAEGLLLEPKEHVLARIVLIPDADVLPEVYAGLQKKDDPAYGVARRLVESGCEVLIPVLVSRENTFSGNPVAGRYTNLPHREWIYRQGFEVGRHIIGYELQKVFAAIDWMTLRNKPNGNNVLIGVAGYGEGGLLALYAAAMDTRISTTLVSGYFNAREGLWNEPIYRNVFGLLKNFGDAELAVMVWPRQLIVEYSKVPEISGPNVTSKGLSSGAAPGYIDTPDFTTASTEFRRAKAMLPEECININWVDGNNGSPSNPFSTKAVSLFAKGLKLKLSDKSVEPLTEMSSFNWVDYTKRQERTVRNMELHIQNVLFLCERTRNKNFWDKLEGDSIDQKSTKKIFREKFRNVIGDMPAPTMPINPRSRILQETTEWISYEIVLDVWPDVFAWGILIIPKDLKPGEKRPVVVCQHGLEGLPMDVVTTDTNSRAFSYYQGFATRLAEQGYVTFSPHNPYRGGDKFRVLQRKANPLGLSLFSVIVGQHQRIVEWLGQLDFIDPLRIGFYGLSYGGKSAMRVPALVEEYALSICSGDFNEWVRKNVSVYDRFSYMFSGEYEMPEWDLGHTFNYAEMAGLIAP